MRLSAFILPEIQNITAKDDMELEKMGERKQAVFAIIPDNDGTFNYIVGMLYTCAFQSLYYQADKVHQGALPVPVRMMMDEFCNVSLPDDFGKLQATMRSRNIMSTIVLQNISALKALFKDDWEGLIGNADTLLYLGGNEVSTFKYISELLGKETLDTRTRSVSKGRSGSSSVNYQQTGNVKKCAVGKHPKSEKLGGIESGRRLRLLPLPVLHRRQSQRVARIDPNAVIVDKNIAENDRFDLFSRQLVCRDLVDLLFFERGEKTFHPCVVETMSGAAEALYHAAARQLGTKG